MNVVSQCLPRCVCVCIRVCIRVCDMHEPASHVDMLDFTFFIYNPEVPEIVLLLEVSVSASWLYL